MSVVIPTHDRAALLRPTLARLLDDPATTEIVVIADACSDGTAQLLEDCASTTSRLRWEAATLRSESSSRQLGAERARGEIVLFLDDDVLPGPGLVAGHAAHHAPGTTGLVVLGSMPVPEPLAGASVGAYDYARAWLDTAARWEAEPEAILSHFWAGNFSMRRDDALRVALRNPAYTGSYHPDFEFGLRCDDAGLQARYAPELRAEHLYTRTIGQYLRDGRRQGESHVLLQRARPELEAPTARTYARATPAPLRPLVRFGHVAAVRRVTQPALVGLSQLLFRAGARDQGRRLAWLARRQSIVAGAQAARHGRH